MPHKHTRRRKTDDSKYLFRLPMSTLNAFANGSRSHNLAPSTIAKPLPVSSKGDGKTGRSKKKPVHDTATSGNPGPKSYKHDDTPRAFSRLMAPQASQKRNRSALDDGNDRQSKKRRKEAKAGDGAPAVPPTVQPSQPLDRPKILPGERLAEFGARVNQTLPISGLIRKGGLKGGGVKERQTKTEKRLQKMYAQWKEDDTRIKDKLEEQREEAEVLDEEREAQYGGQSLTLAENVSRKGKRRKRDTVGGLVDDGDDDPWAELKRTRGGPIGLHDVVQAPPTLRTVPKEKFKVRNGATVDVVNVPNAAGSLKRREELSGARKEVIARYRAMMGRGAC